MIDCHCHLLPAIDDGAKDLDMSLTMARQAVDSGSKGAFCTPHHLDGVYLNPRSTVIEHVNGLRNRLEEQGIDLTLYPGSELHLVPELPSRVLEGDALTFNDKGTVALVELPKKTLPVGSETILQQLLVKKITPLIAHPERNAILAAHPEQIEEWVDWGCKLQLTAQSCTGDFGKPLQSLCRRWCEQGLVHIVASDGHRPSGRPPDLSGGHRVIAQWFDQEAADLLTSDNPRRLVEGEPLQSLPPRDRSEPNRGNGWLKRLLLRPS